MKKILVAFFILFLSLGAFANNCRAEDQNSAKGFSVNPFFQDIILEKDQPEATFPLAVTNSTEVPAVLRLSALDFGALDESGGVAFLGMHNLEQKYGLASWISLEKDALVLGSGETQSVRVTIENRESLSPGGHYGAIFFKLENDARGDSITPSEQVAFQPSFASLIYVKKNGGEIYGLNLTDKIINKNWIGFPSAIKLRFQNPGNVHVSPRGVVNVADPLGRVVMRGIINEESGIILPETFRVFPISLRQIGAMLIPGHYTLSTQYRYDGKEEFSNDKLTFIFIPPIFILLIIILALIIFAGAKLWLKRRKN